MEKRDTHTIDANYRTETALGEQVAFQNALLQVSHAVQQMTRPEHLEVVVAACREQLSGAQYVVCRHCRASIARSRNIHV